MECREGECVFPEEIKLHRDDLVEVPLFISDNLLEDIIRDLPIPIGIIPLILIQILHLYDRRRIRDIHLDLLIPPEISVFLYFCFRETVIYQIRHRIIEIERIEFPWEKIPKNTIRIHLCKNLVRKHFPLLLGVLFIEDAIGFVAETNTTDTEGTIEEKVGIINMR